MRLFWENFFYYMNFVRFLNIMAPKLNRDERERGEREKWEIEGEREERERRRESSYLRTLLCSIIQEESTTNCDYILHTTRVRS